MCCLAGTTWAWFCGSISSSPSKIVAPVFDFQSVTAVNVTDPTAVLSAVKQADGTFTAEFVSDGTYEISIVSEGASGYCVYAASTGDTGQTERFEGAYSFPLAVSGGSTVTFTPILGVPPA